MQKRKYINSNDIDDSIIDTIINITNDKTNVKTNVKYTLKVVILDGYIYRGDKQSQNIIRDIPTFYGDYNAAFAYVRNNEYLKTYITKVPLKLLCLNNTKDNIQLIRKFFKYLIDINDNLTIKIAYILLQIFYGLIDGSFDNIDLCNLELDTIGNYLLNYDKQIKRKRINKDLIDLLKMIINKYKTKNIIPSRVSISEYDFILASMLSDILKPYNIDGLWINNTLLNNTLLNNENLLCRAINRDYYKSTSIKLTCVPSDLCIFNAIKKIQLTKLEQLINNKLININIQFNTDRYINKNRNMYKHMYNKYKQKYLNTKHT